MKKAFLLLTLITCITLTGCQKKQEDISLSENTNSESSQLSEKILVEEKEEEEKIENNKDQSVNEEKKEEVKVDSTINNDKKESISNNKQNSAAQTNTTASTVSSSKKSTQAVINQSTSAAPAVAQKSDPYTEAKKKYSGLDGYNLSINGVNFKMRSEYQKMVSAGWTSNNSKLSGSDTTRYIKINNGNKTMSVSLQNIINSQLSYNQCIVSGILIDKNDIASGTSITLPRNITQNSTPKDVIRAYGQSGYSAEDRKYCYYETEVKGFTILFDENNKVEQIQISNYFR